MWNLPGLSPPVTNVWSFEVHLIVLASNPTAGCAWEQGLEVALNLAEMGAECAVLLEQEFEYACAWNDPEVGFVKKLSQLELYEVAVYAEIPMKFAWIKSCDTSEAARLMAEAAGIMVF